MSGIVKHDQELMKKINKRIILDLIREKRPISRADLAKLTNMSPTSVSRIVTELSDLGLVKETELKSNGVGRKALLLDTDPSSIYIICVQIDQDVSRIGIVDFDGNIIREHLVKYDSNEMDWPTIVDKVCKAAEETVSNTYFDKSKIIGVGVGVPGIIDIKKGLVVFSPQLGWTNVQLACYIEKRLGYKTIIDNIIKSKALAENIFGSAKGSKRAAFIHFGTGVGSALIENDEICRGVTNSAGEIGHTTIDPNGRLCDCGRRGCLQTYITECALIQEARIVKNISSVKEIFESSSKGESWAINILDRLYTYMGITVCDVICMYNPDTVIIGGKLIDQEPKVKDIIIKRVEELIWDPLKGTYKIRCSHLGEKAGLLGVAALVLNKHIDVEL